MTDDGHAARALRIAWLLANAGTLGLTIREMMDQTGASQSAVYRHVDRMREAGWPVETTMHGLKTIYRLAGGLAIAAPPMEEPSTGRACEAGQRAIAWVRELYDKGHDIKEIAEITEYAPLTVKAYLTGHRTDERRKSPVTDRVVELAKEGVRPRDIVEQLSLTRSYVASVLNRARAAGLLPPATRDNRGPDARPRLARGEAKIRVLARLAEGEATTFDLDRACGGDSQDARVALLAEGKIIRAQKGLYTLPPDVANPTGVSFGAQQPNGQRQQIIALARDGVRPREIMMRLQVSRAIVGQTLSSARRSGELPPLEKMPSWGGAHGKKRLPNGEADRRVLERLASGMATTFELDMVCEGDGTRARRRLLAEGRIVRIGQGRYALANTKAAE